MQNFCFEITGKGGVLEVVLQPTHPKAQSHRKPRRPSIKVPTLKWSAQPGPSSEEGLNMSDDLSRGPHSTDLSPHSYKP